MQIETTILDGNSSECDEFVSKMPGAKLCYMPAWTRMVENTFGHRGFYLVARQEGSI